MVLFVLISLGAQKFGHLDCKALLAEMSEMKAANSELAALKDKLQKKGEVMVAALQDEFY